MFRNRLRTFLLILLVITALLMLRALQLQVFNHGQWTERAAKAFAPTAQLTETTRGRILDFKGREVAVDQPCLDLCVDYRAITAPPPGDPDPADPAVTKYLRALALRSATAFFSFGFLGSLYVLYAIRGLHLAPATLGQQLMWPAFPENRERPAAAERAA